ncbi:mitochondrial 54S ribosomal protein bL27m RNJ42_01608 [Nakaseomyces bracarensis]|uniref:mitochondrial 54S ribosomal protein bL27m n=1 Tax=Nakaseomyces bracarensis TaxID=273131 RepID=UPI0038726310
MFSRARQFACQVVVQVRTATKRAAGSRTSMKDSAGRRLGPKKYEGQDVKPGEIIMRQRGTKFYPGENVKIGRDHTIYAVEPGVVRYYLDPFHPRRKFIGVALSRDIKLPKPHFAPNNRRFGRIELTNAKAIAKEKSALPRKEYLARDSLLKGLVDREAKRQEFLDTYWKYVSEELKVPVGNEWKEMASNYLLRYKVGLKNGYCREDAQFNSKYYLEQTLKLKAKRKEWTDEYLNEQLQHLEEVTSLLNRSVSFSNKLDIIPFISDEQRAESRKTLLEALKGFNVVKTKEDKKKITELFKDACNYLSLAEEVQLRRQYMKPVQSEFLDVNVAKTAGKKTKVIRRFNYEKSKIDIIPRTKEAFFKRI